MIGHDAAWAQWREGLASKRMHHAWMLAGRPGLGKMRFALMAAWELVANEQDKEPLGSHPDILVLSRTAKDEKEEKKRDDGKPFERKRNITVGQIRAMQSRLHTRPTVGEKRAVIIDPADDMETGASNALLKSLEEPPPGTYFILIAHRPGRLLPTIRSRCRVVRFPVVPELDMKKFLARNKPEADVSTHSAAIAAANGSPGLALQFVERDMGRLFAVMQALLQGGDPQFEMRARLADLIGPRPDRERLLAILDLAQTVVAKAAGEAPLHGYPAIVDTHSELVRLTAQAPVYNFDSGLLAAQIGTLLANAAASTKAGNV